MEKIKKIYWYGYDLANKNMDKIKAFKENIFLWYDFISFLIKYTKEA